MYCCCIERSCRSDNSENASEQEWRPLLLIVPLRLGLNEINPIYVPGLQVKCALANITSGPIIIFNGVVL